MSSTMVASHGLFPLLENSVSRSVTANALGALAMAIVDGFHAEVSNASGLEPVDAAALNAVGFRPGCSIRCLAGLLGLSHPGAVRCIDRLASGGLVDRLPGPDARTVALKLSRSGRSRWASQRRARMGWLNTLVDGLPPEQRSAADMVVKTLLQKLAPDTAAAERICRFCDEGVCTPAQCPIPEGDPVR